MEAGQDCERRVRPPSALTKDPQLSGFPKPRGRGGRMEPAEWGKRVKLKGGHLYAFLLGMIMVGQGLVGTQ
jgi:hypothetical protein